MIFQISQLSFISWILISSNSTSDEKKGAFHLEIRNTTSKLFFKLQAHFALKMKNN